MCIVANRDEWTEKFFSASPVVIQKISIGSRPDPQKFLNIINPLQSWSAHVKACVVFCLMKHKHYWSYFACNQMRLVEGEIATAVLLPREAKYTTVFSHVQNLTRQCLFCHQRQILPLGQPNWLNCSHYKDDIFRWAYAFFIWTDTQN